MPKKTLLVLALVAAVLAFVPRPALASGAHAFSFTAIDESEKIDLAKYRGKAVLVVNTASFCGFTYQYEGLQALWQRYEDKGLVVLGVPSNDFGGQEPKGEAEIAEFCSGAFNVTFPLTRKYKVKGAKAHSFYQWIASETKGKASPRWNFHKLLIGGDGRLVDWFPSAVKPQSAKLIKAIERELGRSGGAS